MDAIVHNCCGLDVHQATVVACLLTGSSGSKPKKQLRGFGTTLGTGPGLEPEDVRELCALLNAAG